MQLTEARCDRWKRLLSLIYQPFPLVLLGQDAITLLRLQTTPDQTITLSGSPPVQTAPTGFDSTDKWVPGDHPAIERREIKDLLRAKTALYFSSFLPSVP